MLRLKSSRRVEIPHENEKEDISCTFIFEFKYAEDEDHTKMRKLLEKSKDGEISETSEEMNVFYHGVRKSLVGWENILDENEQPLEFSEENQKLVFQYIKEDSVLFSKVLQARSPLLKKTSKSGLTDVSTGDGI